MLRNDLHHLCIYIYIIVLGTYCKLQPVRVNIISVIIILLIISVHINSLPETVYYYFYPVGIYRLFVDSVPVLNRLASVVSCFFDSIV